MALSKNKIKLIASLAKKKERDTLGLFLAEGNKLVSDLLPHFKCQTLICEDSFLSEHPHSQAEEVITAGKEEICRASLLQSPQAALAIFHKPEYKLEPDIKGKLILALDTIQDPGNLGTIIRVADWFGIEEIVCSLETVDAFNPKVVQATMGAIGRVRTHYLKLDQFLSEHADSPIYGTFLNGEDIYQQELTSDGIIVMGNEGNGISETISKLVNKRLFIPNFPKGRATSESLNVAMATGIICSEFRRRL